MTFSNEIDDFKVVTVLNAFITFPDLMQVFSIEDCCKYCYTYCVNVEQVNVEVKLGYVESLENLQFIFYIVI